MVLHTTDQFFTTLMPWVSDVATSNANDIGVSVTARGRTATSDGVGQSDTVYMLT